MIHELLLALRGYPGGLFVGGGLQVSPEPPPFLHPSEAALLARVCRLGALYVRLHEFIEQFAEHALPPPLPPPAAPPQEVLASPPGIYLRAFCTGLDAVLQPYRQALLGLEQEFLADPHLTISYVNYSLDQFQLLFPSLMTVVEQIKIQKIHGCQILETVYKYSRGGLPPVRHALEKVLAMCHAVLYKQLSAWMLHGLLLDQHEEFFIRQGPSLGLTPAQPEEDDDDLGIGGLTGKQLRELQDMRLIEEENMLAPSPKQFSLRMEMLPSYIPARVAEKILFVGESVQMFESQNVTLTKKGSILKNQEETFAAELHRLKQQPLFNLMDFESVIDWIRSTVAEVIKDFYLLGRGELFQAFIDTAQHMLKTPPSAVTEHDVNVAFQQSAHKVLLDDDNLLPFLHLTIHYHGKEPRDPSQNREISSRELSPHESPTSGWAALGLSYQVQWPLHILFTPAVLEKYNVVFKYLLSVRRVQAELQHCWALQMRCKCLESRRTDAIKWRLRHHMTFLVDNLQYYLQVDVLESQFSQLLQQINSTRDFESIRLAHDHFLSNLLAQSFILLKPAFHCLNEILDLCHSFCSLVSQNRGPLDERGTAQLSILAKSRPSFGPGLPTKNQHVVPQGSGAHPSGFLSPPFPSAGTPVAPPGCAQDSSTLCEVYWDLQTVGSTFCILSTIIHGAKGVFPYHQPMVKGVHCSCL
ncbi:gamma-tubulin complex component 4 isoform X2 [Thamnophis elegans]|uniref:gamma-tubulin complex component 4 isoform X2 n=1 Tax=Thamnophis elegans TaxID=35005 RepID=UPI001378F3E6|nr:gamma-tubulin complex component 4 isoform X2 [Thamnophis elegans]